MKRFTLLKTMLLLCALIVGGGSSAWADDVIVLSENFSSNNSNPKLTAAGWTLSGYLTYGATLQIASGSGAGSATTPAFTTLVGNTATLTFTHISSGGAARTLTITGVNCKVNGSASTTVEVPGNSSSAGSATISITEASTTSKITFSAAKSQGTKIDNVVVYYTPVPSSPLDYITLSGTYKTSFYTDEEFTYEGLIVTATLENGDSYEVEPTSVTTPDFSSTGVKTITVSYKKGDVTKTATYDITVSERPKFTVSFSDGGSITESTSGGGVELPSRSNTGDYTFVGWSEANVTTGSSSVTTEDAGETYYPESNCTLYPVYSYSSTGAVNGWFEITEAPEDGNYVIASDNNYAMKASVASSRFENANVTIVAGTPAKLSTPPASNYIWQIYKAADNYYRFKNGENYVGATGSNNQGALLNSESANYAEWTIEYATDKFVIENVDMKAASKNYTLRNNGTYGWGTYSVSQDKAPRLFKNETRNITTTLYSTEIAGVATVTLASACTDGEGKYYGTYSNSSAFIVPDGITVAEIGINEGKLDVQEYSTGDVVPANTGVMVSSATSGDHTISLTAASGTSVLGSDNCLKASGDAGINAAAMEAAAPSCKYYRLTMHNPATENKIGFWWGAPDGAAFDVAANKAYLAVPDGATSRSGFNLFGDDDTTGIEAVDVNTENANVAREYYNLNGQRIANPSKGLYIVNGKKVIIK